MENGRWDTRNERALACWDALLRQGRPTLAVAASDTHTAAPSPNQLGRARTVVQASGLSRAGNCCSAASCSTYYT